MTVRHTFPRSHRLSGQLQFARVFDARVRTSRGPLTVYAAPNERAHSRLGISISRRVGTATRRTGIKRMIREAFRLHQHDLPTGYDWVAVVRPHERAPLQVYRQVLRDAANKLHREWQRRAP